MVVCGQVFTEEVLDKIQAAVESEPAISRRALSVRVCEWLDWRDPRGKPKEMSCRTALLKLHRRGIVRLPEPAGKGCISRAARAEKEPLPQINPVCCSVRELGGVELAPVGSRYSKLSRVWRALMERYHYLGAGPLCGAQMRYLIRSARYGWLGAVAFSASAWRVAARDRWIGWGDAARGKHLSRVVCNSRLLILPQARVANLASHVLSLCAGRIERDWSERYGFAPFLLESFVERERFRGSCYRAANWQHVGTTCGRGRQDSKRSSSVPIKDVYVLPLRTDAREMLCEEGPRPAPQQKERDWAEAEFALADFGDLRLRKRLVTIARDFYARPQGSVPQACHSRAKTKAAYRFFENPETSMDSVLNSHYEATAARVAQERVVLAVQDTTALDYSAHPATERLGPIAFSANGLIGLLLHDTMAFSVDGTPLGLLDAQCWARDGQDMGKKKRRHQLPIDRKESNKWLVALRKLMEVQKRFAETTVVCVADREADIYELFELALSEASAPRLLVRAVHNRILAQEQGNLWQKVAGQPASGIQELRVPRKGKTPARIARLEVRFARVSLRPPKGKPNLGELSVWAVHAREVDEPERVEPLEWMLLTTAQTATFEQAVERLRWYTVRWGIEIYHRTLKSGCKIEERQLGHADRIQSCLAIDLVVAWRIFHLTKLGREIPEVPCTVFFEEAQWKALVAYVTQNPAPPAQPPSLREATRMVASLGGFLGRKSDGEPGTKSLWIGLQRLDDIAGMWKVLTAHHSPHLREPPVSSNPGYG